MQDNSSVSILIFGDIMGRIGREAIKKSLPDLISTYKPNLIVANGENLAHGSGITEITVEEIFKAGIDVLTLGNHAWDNKKGLSVFDDKRYTNRIVRPANYPQDTPGSDHVILKKNGQRYLILNLIGRVFMPGDYDDPFRKVDELLNLYQDEDMITLLDIHTETTAEKNTLGLYLDGRIQAIWGTHTHVPTADERILPKGTAYITDVGMTGGMNGSIGVEYEAVRDQFLTQRSQSFNPIEKGDCEVNAILLKVENKAITSIERVRKIVEIR